MLKGKCDTVNCNKKATSEFLVKRNKTAWTLKFCDKHKPIHTDNNFILIDGKENSANL